MTSDDATREVGLLGPVSFHGRVEVHPVESEVLRDNALGDPRVRELPVYLPPGVGPAHDGDGGRFPVIWILAGLTSNGRKYFETHPWKRSVVARFDDAVAKGKVEPAILVVPDCFTTLGGSQYVNSSAVGRYEDHLVEELVPYVDAAFPVLEGRRGVVGVSSGGFGALHLAMHHPGLFQAAASISGDAWFEGCFGNELLPALRGLALHDFDPAKFLAAFAETHELRGDGHAVLNVLAMSACYSPNPASPLGYDLPMDLETGERDDDVWERWLAFDPLRACEEHTEALRGLELLHLEAGLQDEFHLQWGTRRLAKRLEELGVPCTHEEHPAGHMGLDPRYDPLLARMASVLGRGPRRG